MESKYMLSIHPTTRMTLKDMLRGRSWTQKCLHSVTGSCWYLAEQRLPGGGTGDWRGTRDPAGLGEQLYTLTSWCLHRWWLHRCVQLSKLTELCAGLLTVNHTAIKNRENK